MSDQLEPATVVTVCALTDELRMPTAGSALLDCDHGVQLTFDLAVDRGMIRRRIHRLDGLVEDVWVPMEEACATCSLRMEVVRSVRQWSDHRRQLVVVLPPTTEPAEIVGSLAVLSAEAPEELQLGAVISAVDAISLEHDIFGDDLLDERGWAQSAADRRAVGEVLSHQLEAADVIAVSAPTTPRSAAILKHLSPRASVTEVHELAGRELLAPQGQSTATPVAAMPDSHGVWTIELRSDRPFAPGRLRSDVAELGAGRLRGRGHFWVPTRPGARCVWDGAGGQLSIGPGGVWDESAETRLLITGTDGDPQRLREAFHRMLLTDAEYVAGVRHWASVDDGLDPWLGGRSD